MALARWLHKRMSHNYTQAHFLSPYEIKLSTIIRDSGVKRYERLPNNLTQVKKALEELKLKGVIATYKEEKVSEKRKLIDVKFTISPHPTFTGEVKHANGRARRVTLDETPKKENNRLSSMSSFPKA